MLPIHVRRKARFTATHFIDTLFISVFVLLEKRCLKPRAMPARSIAYPLLLLITAECYWKEQQLTHRGMSKSFVKQVVHLRLREHRGRRGRRNTRVRGSRSY